MGEVPPQLRPHVFKKGNKLGGRKKGKTLKEYARAYLASMTEEQRIEYLNGLPRELIWQMAEGKPSQTQEIPGLEKALALHFDGIFKTTPKTEGDSSEPKEV